MSKFTITVTDFRKFQRNSLRGFATIHVDELKLTIHDIAVHQHANGSRWASLPAKPMIDSSGVAKRNADNKIEYARILSFDTRGVGDAFSAAVLTALIEHDPHALGPE